MARFAYYAISIWIVWVLSPEKVKGGLASDNASTFLIDLFDKPVWSDAHWVFHCSRFRQRTKRTTCQGEDNFDAEAKWILDGTKMHKDPPERVLYFPPQIAPANNLPHSLLVNYCTIRQSCLRPRKIQVNYCRCSCFGSACYASRLKTISSALDNKDLNSKCTLYRASGCEF